MRRGGGLGRGGEGCGGWGGKVRGLGVREGRGGGKGGEGRGVSGDNLNCQHSVRLPSAVPGECPARPRPPRLSLARGLAFRACEQRARSEEGGFREDFPWRESMVAVAEGTPG